MSGYLKSRKKKVESRKPYAVEGYNDGLDKRLDRDLFNELISKKHKSYVVGFILGMIYKQQFRIDELEKVKDAGL